MTDGLIVIALTMLATILSMCLISIAIDCVSIRKLLTRMNEPPKEGDGE